MHTNYRPEQYYRGDRKLFKRTMSTSFQWCYTCIEGQVGLRLHTEYYGRWNFCSYHAWAAWVKWIQFSQLVLPRSRLCGRIRLLLRLIMYSYLFSQVCILLLILIGWNFAHDLSLTFSSNQKWFKNYQTAGRNINTLLKYWVTKLCYCSLTADLNITSLR